MDVRFPVARQPFGVFTDPASILLGPEVLVMTSVTWGFYPEDGRPPHAEHGWYCSKCKTTFFVSDPMTQLYHGCTEPQGGRYPDPRIPM
jgi:hypothetical protein